MLKNGFVKLRKIVKCKVGGVRDKRIVEEEHLQKSGRKQRFSRNRTRKLYCQHPQDEKMFCDDCIKAMLDAVENQPIGELVICDTNSNVFYPVEDEGRVQIEDYAFETEYKDGDYEIVVKSFDENE